MQPIIKLGVCTYVDPFHVAAVIQSFRHDDDSEEPVPYATLVMHDGTAIHVTDVSVEQAAQTIIDHVATVVGAAS